MIIYVVLIKQLNTITVSPKKKLKKIIDWTSSAHWVQVKQALVASSQ